MQIRGNDTSFFPQHRVLAMTSLNPDEEEGSGSQARAAELDEVKTELNGLYRQEMKRLVEGQVRLEGITTRLVGMNRS